MKSDINEYIDNHFDEMVEQLKKLISIDSTTAAKKDDMPFGLGVHKALLFAKEMLDEYGFKTTNYDNYVLTADLNDYKYGLDILAHLDVVLPGDAWNICSPFSPVIVDGKIYGRGTADDKGPAIAAIFGMRAVKDLGYKLKKGVRLILGTDEECGSSDLEYYYSKEKEAEMSFTPDAEFPLINTEKGRLSSNFTAKLTTDTNKKSIIEINAGIQSNVIPSKSNFKLINVKKSEIEDVMEKLNLDNIKAWINEKDNICDICIEGVGGHAAYPEKAVNSLTAMLYILSNLDLSDTQINDFIKKLSKIFVHGDYYGKNCGIAMHDKIAGFLTISLNMMKYKDEEFDAIFDCRAPLCANDDNLTKVIATKLKNIGCIMHEKSMVQPHHVSATSPFVKTLLEVYEDYFGVKGVPQSTGGGTYVHNLKNGVAFGCEIEGVDNHMHGADEFMDLEILRKSAKIFAEAIIKLCS